MLYRAYNKHNNSYFERQITAYFKEIIFQYFRTFTANEEMFHLFSTLGI
jgi:hypothetical protein